MMKAVTIHHPGGPEQLMFGERPIPQLREGWSLVRIRAFGINRSEIFTRQGLSPSVQFPRILGIECVGEVAHSSTERLQAGQKVVSIMGEMRRAFDGSYAEYALLPNAQIHPVSTSLPWAELAAMPESGYTAFGALQNLQIKAADRVLVRGAASSVGVIFAQLARGSLPGIHLTASSRSTSKADRLHHAGFDEVILDHNNLLQTEQHFDKILELIGPLTIANSFEHIREHGIVCSVGQLGGKWYLEDFDPIMALKNNSYLSSFYSGDVDEKKLGALFQFIEDHHIRIKPERTFGLEQIQDAHRYLESADGFGKVVVVND